MPDEDAKPGYRNPPKSTRFKPGQSGNPKGRPPNRHRDELPYEEVLGQPVTISVDGARQQVKAEEAFLRKVVVNGLSGKSAAAINLLNTIETLRQELEGYSSLAIDEVQFVPMSGVNNALEYLRMARPLYRDQPNAHMAIEPWLVEAALERLGNRRLTLEEQEEVVRATRTPHKVNWPDWWEALPPNWRKAKPSGQRDAR